MRTCGQDLAASASLSSVGLLESSSWALSNRNRIGPSWATLARLSSQALARSCSGVGGGAGGAGGVSTRATCGGSGGLAGGGGGGAGVSVRAVCGGSGAVVGGG